MPFQAIIDALSHATNERANLLRDVADLLNTRTTDYPDDHPLARSSLGFGLPEPPALEPVGGYFAHMVRLIARQLQRFEPRLRRLRVTHANGEFVIHAQVAVLKSETIIWKPIVLIVTPETKAYTVREGK